MLSSCLDEIDKPEAALSSFSAPAGDETLVLAAKNGNEQAFEILVECYRRAKTGSLALPFRSGAQ